MASVSHRAACTYRPRSLRDEKPLLRMESGEGRGGEVDLQASSGLAGCRQARTLVGIRSALNFLE